MKILLLVLLLPNTKALIAQDHTLYITDSLIKENKVKSRLWFVPGATHGSQFKEEFDKSGKLVQSTRYHPFTFEPSIETKYYYDSSGRLYAKGSTNISKLHSKNFLTDANENEVSHLISYYQYDKENRLARIYIPDSMGRTTYESLHTYNPTVVDKTWYNNAGIWKQAIDSFEKNIYVVSMHIKTFEPADQSILNESRHRYENSYDHSGRIIQTVYQSDRCSSIIRYDYLDNGLIKKKIGDNCHHPWQYSYKYYK